MALSVERWVPVHGFEGFYEISDQGRVKSVPRTIVRKNGTVQTFASKILATSRTEKHPHPRPVLYRQGSSRGVRVHRLVAEAFVPGYSAELEVCHRDGDPTNNNYLNLRWDTQSANGYDRGTHGTDHELNKTHCPYGHAYSEDNVYRSPSRPRSRNCLTCIRVRNAQSKSVLMGRSS